MPKKAGTNYVYVTSKLHEAVGEAGKARHMTYRQISEWVLGCRPDYLASVLTKAEPKLDEELFLKLVIWLGNCEPEDFMRDAKKPEAPKDAKAAPVHEDVITGVTGIYNKVNELLTEQKTTNIILREMLKYMASMNDGMTGLDNFKELASTAVTDIHKTREHTAQIFTELKYNVGGRK